MRRAPLWILTVFSITSAAPCFPQASPLAVELQSAIQRETVQGDLQGALRQYERILSRSGSDRETAARALLRIGQCHEKLGNAEARKAYERLVREFSDQKDSAEAKSRLAALSGAGVASGDRVLYSSESMFDVRPSRDGRYAAFLCGRAICVLETASGSVRTVVPPPTAPAARHWRPLVSPDGSQVAYTHFADEANRHTGDLRIARANQPNDSLLLTGNSDDSDYFAAVDWSGDGTQILVATTNTKRRGLLMVAARGGATREVETPDFNWWTGRRLSRLSPDGRWIAYPAATPEQGFRGYVPTDVRIVPAAGGPSTVAMMGPAHDFPLGWLANGDLIVASARSGHPRAYRLSIASGIVSGEPQLLRVNLGEKADAEQTVGVALNGALYFLEYERQSDLYSFRSADDPMRKLPLGFQGGRPAFSPDGDRLAYVVGGANENSIVIRQMASGEEKVLPGKIPTVLRLSWFPDGRSVFAICNTGNYGRRPTFRFQVDSGEMRSTPDLVDLETWYNPTISADGGTLLYSSKQQIVGLDLQTGMVRTVFRPRAEGYSIGVFGLSKDRKSIAYVEGNRQDGTEFLMVSSIENPQPKTLCASPNCFPRTPHFGPGDRSIIFWSRGAAGQPKDLWQIPAEGGEPRLLRAMPWTMDGPAIHPTSGEIVIGSGKQIAHLHVKRLE